MKNFTFCAFLYISLLCYFVSSSNPSDTCKSPNTIVEFKWEHSPEALYFVLSSPGNTNMFKKMLHQDDISKLCPRLVYNSTDATIYSGSELGHAANFFIGDRDGYGKLYSFTAKYYGNNPDFTHKVQVAISDHETYGLAFICWGNGVRGWVVFSKFPVISEKLKMKILNEVQSMGFDSEDYRTINFANCS